MQINKKYKISTVVVLIVLFFFWGGVEINEKIEWKMTEDLIAGGGFPYEIGCMNAVTIPCFTVGTPPVCSGGALCYTLDPGRCLLYSDVTGVPTGVNPCNVLYLKTSMAMAGLVGGASYIAAGAGPTLMDQGPLASWGGCVNCYAQNESKWKQKFAVAKDMFMAMFKD
jgi:hypothetical protein